MHLLERLIPSRRVICVEDSQEVLGPQAMGSRLKTFFDGVTTSSPMPDRLAELADALEDALERGDLGCCAKSGRTL